MQNQFSKVSEQIEEIKSNVDLVKVGVEEKVENQLKLISVKLNEIENRKEPVVAFRANRVKNAKGSSTEVNFNPGEYKSKNV